MDSKEVYHFKRCGVYYNGQCLALVGGAYGHKTDGTAPCAVLGNRLCIVQEYEGADDGKANNDFFHCLELGAKIVRVKGGNVSALQGKGIQRRSGFSGTFIPAKK